MKLVTQVEIDRPLTRVMALMADPSKNVLWMMDLESYSPAEGDKNVRLSFKNGMVFSLSRLPSNDAQELRSKLEGKNLTITTTAYFKKISPQKTGLCFEQDFTFNGPSKILGLIGRRVIHKQQQQHMHDFKRFVEDEH